MTRFPFAPLAELIEARWRPTNEQHSYTLVGMVCEELGVCNSTVHRWMDHGMSPVVADRAASRLGFHPGLVWPEWWDLEEAA